MENLFRIEEKGSKISTEVIAGVTTFFSMAYIIFVNPGMLSLTGMDYSAVLIATCLAAALGTFLTALLGNVPFAQAPGMGLNAFFTFTICFQMGYSWQQGLTIVLISGILFLIVAVSPLRGKVIASIPLPLKKAIGAGIGLFIALIGMLNAGIVTADGNLLSLGNITKEGALLALIGLVITAVLLAWRIKGAMLIGIVVTTIIGIPMGITTFQSPDVSKFALTTFFQFDFGGIVSLGILPLVTAILTFAMVDMFDTVGTLIGTADSAGMLDDEGNLPGGDMAIVADAIATCTGAVLGTSTVTTYIESSTGISEGGKTGLSSVVTGLMFLIFIPLAVFGQIIPIAATAPALIIVGVLMLRSAGDIEWGDFEIALPCFLTIVMMPFSYSISDGIGFGFISFSLIKLLRGKAKEVPILVYIISLLFITLYILSSLL